MDGASRMLSLFIQVVLSKFSEKGKEAYCVGVMVIKFVFVIVWDEPAFEVVSLTVYVPVVV